MELSKVYNLNIWGSIVKVSDLSDFEKNFQFNDLLYHFTHNPYYLDILIYNSHLKSDYILVTFSGAVAERDLKEAPFLSGKRLSDKAKLPLIAIGDPTVSLNQNVGLSWYAGSKENIDLQEKIAKTLDFLAVKINKKLILLGGSGGGFAALSIYQKMSQEAHVIAMNPQIVIEKYFKKTVINYIHNAFDVNETKIKELDTTDLGLLLDNYGLLHNLTSINRKKNVLILQNRSDMQVARHLEPFIKCNGYSVSSQKYLYELSSDNSFILVGHWGKGHFTLPVSFILSLIENFILNKQEEVGINTLYLKDLLKHIDLKFKKEDNALGIEVLHCFDESLLFCFILYENNIEISRSNYQKQLKYTFGNKINIGYEYKIRFYIRDKLGNRASKTVSL